MMRLHHCLHTQSHTRARPRVLGADIPPSLINLEVCYYGRYLDPREVSGYNNKQQTVTHTHTQPINRLEMSHGWLQQ